MLLAVGVGGTRDNGVDGGASDGVSLTPLPSPFGVVALILRSACKDSGVGCKTAVKILGFAASLVVVDSDGCVGAVTLSLSFSSSGDCFGLSVSLLAIPFSVTCSSFGNGT